MYTINQKGFTLLEVLVYIGLFSIIMFGALVGALYIIDGNVDVRSQITLEQEANFIFRKIEWAMNGEVTDISTIANGFRITKPGDNIEFVLDSDTLTLDTGSGFENLTPSSIEVSALSVNIIPASPPIPEALEISFMLNNKQFASSVRYVRQ